MDDTVSGGTDDADDAPHDDGARALDRPRTPGEVGALVAARHQQLLRAGQVAVVQVKQRQLLVKKTVIPVVVALFLFSMFSRIFIENGAPDYFLIWLACGVPFGIGKMFTLIPIGFGISGTVGVVALNLVLGGLIGGVILIWKLAVVLWYLPLTIYRLVT